MQGFLELLSEELGRSIPAGDNTRFCCPFCSDEKFKFYVRNDTGIYQCFHCGAKGNPIKFLHIYYSYTFTEAKDLVEEWTGISLDLETTARYPELSDTEALYLALSTGREAKVTNKVVKTTIPLPTNLKLIQDNLNNPEAYPYIQYLYNRGITLEDIKQYVIGYVVQGRVRKSNKDEQGNFEYFNMRNSIVFLTFDNKGRYLYWNSRSIELNPVVKSLNGPATLEEHSKNDVIFNLNNAKETGVVIIFEGVFNAITAGISGVATFGKMVTDDQVERLKEVYKEHPETCFVIFLDSDARRQEIDLARRLVAFTSKVYLVDSPYGEKDANDLGREITLDLVKRAKLYSETSELSLLVHGLNL